MAALRSRRISLEAALWSLGLVGLCVSAVFLPPLDSREPAGSWVVWMGAIIGAIAVGSILTGTFLYLYKAWRRVPVAPNRRQYVLWVGFETAAVLTLLALCISGLARS
jgi:protein-S-isoprenylcysteine O-methyltransferase Ste14